MTREEKAAALLALFGCLPTLADGYRNSFGRLALAVMVDVVVVIALIIIAAGVRLGRRSVREPRMTILILAVIAMPMSFMAGVAADKLDFKYRRKGQYERLIATIKRPVQPGPTERAPVIVPPDLAVDAQQVWATWQEDGQLSVEFLWEGSVFSHLVYVYCAGGACAPEADWHGYVRLDDHWRLVSY